MAKRNYNQYIKDEAQVRTKKYLYVIRPLVMLLYLEQHGGEMPYSVSFPDTLAHVQLPAETDEHIHALIETKQSGVELGLGEHNIVLDAFIEECLERWSTLTLDDQHNTYAVSKATSNIITNIWGLPSVRPSESS